MNLVAAHSFAEACPDEPDEPEAYYQANYSEDIFGALGYNPVVKLLVKLFYFHKLKAKVTLFLFTVDGNKKFRSFKKYPV